MDQLLPVVLRRLDRVDRFDVRPRRCENTLPQRSQPFTPATDPERRTQLGSVRPGHLHLVELATQIHSHVGPLTHRAPSWS